LALVAEGHATAAAGEAEQVPQEPAPMPEIEGATSSIEAIGHSTHPDSEDRLDQVSVATIDRMTNDVDAEAQDSLEAGRRYMEKKRYLAAAEETFVGLSVAPEYLPLHLQLAEILFAQGRIEEAVSKYLMVAETKVTRGDLDGAMAALRRVRTLAPLDTVARLRLIELLVEGGRGEEGLEICYQLADAYYEMTQIDEAIEAYQQALEICRQIPAARQKELEILHLLVDLQLEAGLHGEAAETAQQLVELEPGRTEEYRRLISQHSAGGNANV